MQILLSFQLVPRIKIEKSVNVNVNFATRMKYISICAHYPKDSAV